MAVSSNGRAGQGAFSLRLAQGALVCAFLIGLLSVRVMLSEVGQPFAGVIVAPATGGLRADNGTPPWWPAMSLLRTSDTIVGIGTVDALQDRVIRAADTPEKTLGVSVMGIDGAQRDIRLPISRYTLGHALDLRAIEILNGLTLWLIGVLILRARPADRFNQTVALACALFSMNQWLWHGAVLSSAPSGSALLIIAWSIVTPLVGPALFAFGLRAVQSNPSAPLHGASRFAAWASWLIALAVLLASAVLLTIGAGIDPLVVYRANIVLTFGGAVGVLALLAGSLFARDDQRRVRNQRKLMATGFVIALPALVTHAAMLWRGHGSFFVFGGLDIRVLYLAVPIMLSVAILRYQTFKSESRAQLLLANMAAAIAIASLGDWLTRALLTTRAEFTLPPFLVIFGLVFVLMLVIELLRRRGLQRVFRWQSMSTQSARQFGERLAGQTDAATLPGHIVSGLIDELNLECAALWLKTEDGGLQLAAHAPTHMTAPQIDNIAPPELRSAALANPEAPMRIPESHGTSGYEALVGLSAVESTGAAGLLALGKRADEEIFHESDFEIIELIAQQSALLLANARQIGVLRAVPARIAAAQERERSRIAQELHDTIQQFLGRLPFLLEAGRAQIRTQPESADAQLVRVIDDVQQAARTVREIRADLAPVQLQGGLRAPLLDLLTRFGERTQLAVAHDIDAAIDDALALGARHALYRVAQQALDNIEAHAHARQVTFTLRLDPDIRRVKLHIRDDGKGFAPDRPHQAAADGHLGLVSMQARIASVGGELHISSAGHSGVSIACWVPAQA